MYKVFRKEKWIYISKSADFSEFASDVICVENPSEQEVKDAAKAFLSDQGPNMVFTGETEEIFSLFARGFTDITAAGGIVRNPTNHLLMIHRLGVWDLPKGKVDEGEGVADAAIREVEEETGIQGLHLEEKVNSTYHIYPRKGKEYLKTTHWYRMRILNHQEGLPQTEEDIDKVIWAKPEEVEAFTKSTYPALVELLQEETLRYHHRSS